LLDGTHFVWVNFNQITMLKPTTFLSSLIIILLVSSCATKEKKSEYPDTDMYDFSNPKILELETALDEISGIVYYPKDTSVFAIVDNAGSLFKIPLNNHLKSQRWTFAKSRDYEDLVLLDSIFYVLVSNGDIEMIRFENDLPVSKKVDFGLGGKKTNEFESLFKNEFDNSLTLLCKSCEADKKESLTSYKIMLGDSMNLQIDSAYDMRDFSQASGSDKHLKPSAAAVNPITGEIYIVSSILKSMVIFNRDKTFKEYVKLSPSIYKQPEGMAFTPEGDLIISNEFAEQGLATLLLLKNKKK
jgi:uncharacterized protein YjiK